MYAGHVGIALGLRAAGRAPLWALVLAAQGPDWLDAAWNAAGLPRNYPWWKPHAFVPMLVGAGVAAGLAAVLAGRGRPRARVAALVGAAYLSHWPADFVTGYKPTWPRGPSVGLGLYADPLSDFAVEACVVVLGWAVWCGTLPDVREARWRALVALGTLASLLALQALADVIIAGGWGPLA